MESDGTTLNEILPAKVLDHQFATQVMGWKDTRWARRVNAVHIPYYDLEGQKSIRYRTALAGADRFRWSKSPHITLYGLQHLAWSRKQGWVNLVEGETDTLQLMQRGIPALGVPGVESWKPDWAKALSGLQVFVWQESDRAGQTLAKAVCRDIPTAGIIVAPVHAKDPCELAALDPNHFMPTFAALVAQAYTPVEPPPQAPPEEPADWEIPHDTWEDPPIYDLEEELASPGYPSDANAKGDGRARREKVVEAYRWEGDELSARRVSRCALYRQLALWSCGLKEGIPFHCNKFGCAVCHAISHRRLFTAKPQEMEALVQPVVYQIGLGSLGLTLPADLTDLDGATEVFAQGVLRARKMLPIWARRVGEKVPLARHAVYSLGCTVTAGPDGAYEPRFNLVLIGNWVPGTDQAVRQAFGTEVQERNFANRDQAIEAFVAMAANQFQWDLPQHFYAWKAANKRKKLMQGRGAFRQVTVKGEQLPPATGGICPEHGDLDTFERMKLVGGPERWQRCWSSHTRRPYYVLLGEMEDLVEKDMPDDTG